MLYFCTKKQKNNRMQMFSLFVNIDYKIYEEGPFDGPNCVVFLKICSYIKTYFDWMCIHENKNSISVDLNLFN